MEGALSFRSVVANVLDFDSIESEFKFQSHHYVHFQINVIGKSFEPLILSAIGLIVPLLQQINQTNNFFKLQK